MPPMHVDHPDFVKLKKAIKHYHYCLDEIKAAQKESILGNTLTDLKAYRSELIVKIAQLRTKIVLDTVSSR